LRDEPEQMDAPPALEHAAQRRVLEERAVGDRAVHTHQVLVEAPPGTDREVADLGVAHLPRRQSDGLAGRVERRVRVGAPQAVEVRRVRQFDRVARPGRGATPAVEDDESYEWAAA